jgi:hypothetical protein
VFEGMRRSRAREKGKRDGRTWWKGRESNTVRRKMPGYLYLSQCLRERDRVSLPLVLLWHEVAGMGNQPPTENDRFETVLRFIGTE